MVKADPRPWADARDLLCVRLDAIGDVLMTTPAIRALRRSAPGRRITLLTSSAGADVAALVPEIDDVIPYAAPWMKASPPAGAEADHAMVDRVRRGRFDGAVIFTVFSQSPLPAALLCRLAEVPRTLAHCRENPYWLLSDWVPDPEPEQMVRHEVQRQLDLVAAIGCATDDDRLSLAVPESARRQADALLGSLGVDGGPWAVVHPGASAPSRRYPWEHYVRACRALAVDHGWRIVFTGAPEEVELVERIRHALETPSASVAGRLDIPGLAALLERAPVLIAGNTGPVHVAAAVGTPVVDLYALTNPQHTPWNVPSAVLSHDVPCRNCYKSVCPMGHHDCLRKVEPHQVVAAAVRLQDSAGRVEDRGAAPR